MTHDAYCTTCRRIVQLESQAESVCPVCSSTLVAVPDDLEGSQEQEVQGDYEPHRVDIHYLEENNGWEHLESG